MKPPSLSALALSSLLTASSLAQPTIDFFTIDCGTISLSGSVITLVGTIGQHDASTPISGGQFTISGGFWNASVPFCPADFNRDYTVDFFDYLDFVDAFSSADAAADFNQDSVVDFFDYLDFVDYFSFGC